MGCEGGEEAKDKASKVGHREVVNDPESYVKEFGLYSVGGAPEKFLKRGLK